MAKSKNATKKAIMHAMKNTNPVSPPDPITIANESAERAYTEVPTDKLAGIKFAIVLDGQLIQSPRQLTVPTYESWAKLTWARMHEFYSANQRPHMPLNWVFKRALVWWIEAMYARNDPDSFE